ncbi:hypothetical protein EJ02DRAFT_457450 [Clathrospora elynae]|uniref:SP-RING-type domain-containing protein n=1 Tax=Clathrospora elynae TaxID=706981 RepID=A0A6A5SE81_9PLEO|nr:hypothetical protein EJ02DRAFT_457450 [Clathrospora elynae]
MASHNDYPTAWSVSSRATPHELPPYKKPSHPLDAEATRALRELQGRYLKKVQDQNKKAAALIPTSAEGVNDMLRDHARYIERRQRKWAAGKGLEDKEEEERQMEELQAKVDEATARLEESMRAVIDSGVAAQRIDDTLDWLRNNAPKQLEDDYQTQITHRATQRHSQSQAESQQRRTQQGDGDEDVTMDGAPTPGPTPLDGSRVSLTGASEMFTTCMQREKNIYTSLSLTARYARNNDYRDFKRIVHDAKFGDSGPTLGNEDTWFTETGLPAPGITDSTQRGDFDDDDDIVVDKATISTRCPITFQQFKDPVTSTKCPHTFEKSAILDMIRHGDRHIGVAGQRGQTQRAVDCPVSGCSQMLTATDVRSDPIIIRKIQRMQQTEAQEAEDSSDDEVQAPCRDVELIDSDEETQESSRLQVSATQQPPNSSIVEDLGSPGTNDEDV